MQTNLKFEINSTGDNNIYAGSTDGNLYVLNNDGSPKWSFNAGGVVQTVFDASGIENEPYLYVGTNNGLLYKIANEDNSTSASSVWTYPLSLGSAISSNIAYFGLTSTYLYVGTQDGHIFKITSDGALVSEWVTNPGLSGGMYGTPIIDPYTSLNDNGIWFGTTNGTFYRTNMGDNGTITASNTTAVSIQTSPYLTIGGSTHMVYFGDDSGNLRCRYASNLVSIPAGWTDVQVSSPIRSSPWVDTGSNAVYFGCDNGQFYKVDMTSGTILWSFQTGGSIRSSCVLGNNNDVYFGSDDGYLYGLDIRYGTPTIPNFPIQTGAEIRCALIYDQGYGPDSGDNTDPPHHDGYDWLIFSSNDGKVYCISIADSGD
jgi:outer membrane protein assembly factor BamB